MEQAGAPVTRQPRCGLPLPVLREQSPPTLTPHCCSSDVGAGEQENVAWVPHGTCLPQFGDKDATLLAKAARGFEEVRVARDLARVVGAHVGGASINDNKNTRGLVTPAQPGLGNPNALMF